MTLAPSKPRRAKAPTESTVRAPADNLPQADVHALSIAQAPADPLGSDHVGSDAHAVTVAPNTLDGSHTGCDPQADAAPVNLLPGDRESADAPVTAVAGNQLADGPESAEDQPTRAVGNDFALLSSAELLTDLERVRIANQHRARQLAEQGFDTTLYDVQVEGLKAMEHQVDLAMRRMLRAHPLGPWVKRTIGIGERQGARLLAALGDPYWNHAEDRPRRGPAELWAYCGFAPGQKRRKGVKSNWNATAKMRAFLIAESCIKQMHSPYRADYDNARAAWADRDTTDGHKHNHALRVVAKSVLRDMWIEAKRVREIDA